MSDDFIYLVNAHLVGKVCIEWLALFYGTS
jgi:hypothetical protein